MIVFLIILFLFQFDCYAQQSSSSPSSVVVTELDGSPSVRARTLKFSNGTVTDNLDGSASISSGGSSVASGWTTDSATRTVTSYNVGIGTTIPATQLDVRANFCLISSGTTLNSGFAGYQSNNDLNKKMQTGIFGSAYIPAVNPGGYSYGDGFIASDSSFVVSAVDTIKLFTTASNTERMRITGAGNVGIGTSSPSTLLDVQSSAGSPIARFGISNSSSILVDSNGNLGISTSSPRAKLEVDGNIYVTGGNIGIGTAIPAALLVVAGSDATAYTSSANTAVINTLLNTNTTNNNFSSYSMQVLDTNGALTSSARMIAKCTSHTAGAVSSTWILQTRNSGTLIDALTVLSSGNLGINSTIPQAKLEVDGGIYQTGGTVALGLNSGNVGIGTSAPTGAFIVTSQDTIGWSVKSATAQTCSAVCTASCVAGWTAVGILSPCSTSITGSCLCAGSS